MPSGKLSRVIQHLHRAALLPDGGGMTDGQLLECFITERDEAAFAALMRRHGPMVLGVCRRVLRNTHDAEDAFQATFLVLARKATSIRQRELLGNWLYGAAYRAALEAKAAKRRVRERQVSAMPESVAAAETDVWLDLRPILDQELSRLPDKYRVPVVLCDLEGRTRRHVARQLGIPAGTLSGRLTTARRLLAKRLARHGFALAGGALVSALSGGAALACVPSPLVGSTVKAAALLAAGQAAPAGLISAKVAALTEGVLKTMLLTKLKVATAILLAVAIAGVGAAGLLRQTQASEAAKAQGQSEKDDKQAAPTPKEDKDKLLGTWRLVRAQSDGLTLGEGRSEIKDTLMVFEKSSVTMIGKAIYDPRIKKEPEDVKMVGTFTLDTEKNPKQIVVTWESNPLLTKEYLTQRGIYALNGDSLKLCFYFPGSDTKLLVPTEFSAKTGKAERHDLEARFGI